MRHFESFCALGNKKKQGLGVRALPCSASIPNIPMDRYSRNRFSSQRGTTLIELSVVIAVLLVLTGVLFIGIGAWKAGANKAGCIMNLASIQKAVRGYQNMNALNTGDAETEPSLKAAGYWVQTPVCPAAGVYAFGSVVPGSGAAYCTCSFAVSQGHAPSTATLANW
jgi:prepilin-type N-terminal cleavage/methylation domain-containing protein